MSGLCCLIFGLSVELIGRNPSNMLRIRDKEEGSAINVEGSAITSEDPAITSEGSAIKKDDYVKESENLYPYWRIDISPVSFKMRVDTMIFSEKTFSLRCQLQIHDGVATLVFWLLFFMLKINDNNNNNNNNNTVL